MSEVKDICVGNEPPTEALKGEKSWQMIQVWVKCPRAALNSALTGNTGSEQQQSLLANKKLRGRPHGTTIAKREKHEIKNEGAQTKYLSKKNDLLKGKN